MKPDDVVVEVWHVWGNIPCSLSAWVKIGPGLRVMTAPGKAWHKQSCVEISLDMIPRPFRNDRYSVRLILDGITADPWHRDRRLLQYVTDNVSEDDKQKRDQVYESIKVRFLDELTRAEKTGETTLYELCWQIINSQ